jgi:hypothetical protein
MPKPIDTLLLLALPAGGKSDVRRYLKALDPAECRDHFGIGPIVQLDDFPYVHLMRRISDELTTRGYEGPYFLSSQLPFRDPRDWGTLIELLNEDDNDLQTGTRSRPASAAEWLFDRLNRARTLVGAEPKLRKLPDSLRLELAEVLEEECRDLLEKKNAAIPDSLDGKTVVIEFARGGADGSTMPLPAPYGYRHSLSRLHERILARAAVLYVWVTPQESRRKNTERTDPNDPGSVLHHGVPNAVMYGDYGCDDVNWLLETSGRPGTLRVESGGKVFHLPVGRLDNRQDRTTFLREDPSAWPPEAVAELHAGLAEAFAQIHRAR